MASNALEQFLKWEREIPDTVFLRQPVQGVWKTWTYRQAGDEVRRIAAGLTSMNYPTGSAIAILSKNCAHWLLADLAIMMCGHVSVPLYATLSSSSIQQILEHAEVKLVFTGKLDTYDEQRAGIPSSVQIVGIEYYGVHESISWEHWIATQQPLAHYHTWKPTDLLTIIYTSGTTGKPKGVMHTVEAFDATIEAAVPELNLRLHPRLFSYLPLCHIAERVGIEMMGIYCGGTFSFAESLDTFAQNLADTQPHNFFAVPRIWAKFREKILEKIPEQKLNTLLKIPVINSLIRSSIKKKLGLAHADIIVTGAAPIAVDLLKWYEKIGIEVLQAYGMTEDSVYAHFNRHGANRHGTVGKPLKGLLVKISDEGEIRIKCKGLTIGYYKEPEMTRDLFDEEGYLKTGDQGEISSDGYLTITGRVKDQFKTDKGKYISPAPIEMRLLQCPDIEQVCVVGMGVPQPIALIVLSAAGKAKSRPQLTQVFTELFSHINPDLESYEQLATAVIMKDDWTIENGLLTPSLKIKRNEVEKIHLPHYPRWYHQDGLVVWE